MTVIKHSQVCSSAYTLILFLHHKALCCMSCYTAHLQLSWSMFCMLALHGERYVSKQNRGQQLVSTGDRPSSILATEVYVENKRHST